MNKLTEKSAETGTAIDLLFGEINRIVRFYLYRTYAKRSILSVIYCFGVIDRW
ncbi:MAG: hypothetical protein K1X92_04225 [Bacteroidia bacterium]|nr:hypothetical protein [Bacteroidia bacterium]